MYKKVYSEIQDEMVYKKVMEDMFSRKLAAQQFIINKVGHSAEILHVIAKEGEIVPSTLVSIDDSNVSACDRRKASSSNTATCVHTIVIQLMRTHILITTHPKLAYNYKYVI